MLNAIKIFNRFTMENFARGMKFPYDGQRWHLVSIYGGEDEVFLTGRNRDIFAAAGCRRFLSLRFWDIIESRDAQSQGLFQQSQAREVITLLDAIQQEADDSILIVHCHAGISRSAAIATFACDYCGLDYREFLEANPDIMANPYVLHVLQEASGKPPSFAWHDGIDHTQEEPMLLPPWAQKH